MTTFADTTHLERIALCARAMGIQLMGRPPDDTFHRAMYGEIYDPYTNKAQAFELLERLQATVSLHISNLRMTYYPGHMFADREDESLQNGLPSAICNLVAHMQWEKESRT